MGAMAELVGGLDERSDRGIVRHRGVTLMHEVLGRCFEAYRAAADDQVAERDVVFEHTARADANEGWVLCDRQDLGQDDLDVVRADAGRDRRQAQAAVLAGDRARTRGAGALARPNRSGWRSSRRDPDRPAAGRTRRPRPAPVRCGTAVPWQALRLGDRPMRPGPPATLPAASAGRGPR